MKNKTNFEENADVKSKKCLALNDGNKNDFILLNL